MSNEIEGIELKDIANDLLIVNRHTIETLFRLENCADCVALYMFYYKTAKWQETNQIKANDTYIAKSLKWGTKKIRDTKKTLKENGLIDIVQKRENGKIVGWYIKLSYIVTKKNIGEIKVKVDKTLENQGLSKNASNQQVVKATSGFQETNALKEKNKCLKKTKEKKERNEQSYDEILDEMILDDSVKEVMLEFIKMRKLSKKPLTNTALKLIINKLYKLSLVKEEQIEILQNSIMNNWQGIYPLKKEIQPVSKNSFSSQRHYTAEELEYFSNLGA